MTTDETVEALMQTLIRSSDQGLSPPELSYYSVRALVTSLVQEKADLQGEYKLFVDEVVAAELMIDKALDISGPVLCQNVELLIDAKEAAEARLAAVEQALQKIAKNPDECGCTHDDENCCNLVGVFCSTCIAFAALTPSRRNET